MSKSTSYEPISNGASAKVKRMITHAQAVIEGAKHANPEVVRRQAAKLLEPPNLLAVEYTRAVKKGNPARVVQLNGILTQLGRLASVPTIQQPKVEMTLRPRLPLKISTRMALEDLAVALKHYIADEPQSNYDGRGPVTGGHPVHRKVVALEEFYPGGYLPEEVRLDWIGLLKESQAGRFDEAVILAKKMLVWCSSAKPPNRGVELSGGQGAGSAPAVDDTDIRILRIMASQPSYLWTQEQIETSSRMMRLLVSRSTISDRWLGLEEAKLIVGVEGKRGKQITERGVSIVKDHSEAEPAAKATRPPVARQKARPSS